MEERREVERRVSKAYTCFPAVDNQGNFIMSERRHTSTKHICDGLADEVDLPTMFLDINKQI